MIDQTISHFKILDKLGQGGMGEVYKAFDTRLKRLVAIKVLPPELVSDVARRKRFQAEAEAASALNHPNICTVYEIDEIDGNLFIVMEYLEGKTLQDLLTKTPFDIQETLDISIQVAAALEKTHKRHIVHRDIKPSNILLTEEGQAKVLDFGLARVGQPLSLDSLSLITTSASPPSEDVGIAGTVAYMSPEQVSGKETDGRSDMFSFAIVLYQMLTGKHPFPGKTIFEIASAILKETPVPPSKENPSVPAPLEQIVFRMLQKKREDRYGSMAEVLADLKRFRGDSSATHVTLLLPPEMLRRFLRVGLLLLIVGLAVFGYFRYRGSTVIREPLHIAVLPFSNVGADQSNQAFCDGMIETLTSQLTQIEEFEGSLWVVPASEIRKQQVSSAQEARRVFGVSLVVTGSVYRAGDQIRLTANLIDAKTLRQLRAITMQTRAGDLFQLQDGAIRGITEMMSLQLSPQQTKVLLAGGTSDPSAYDFYLQARGYLQRYERQENVDSAIALFKQALAQDPRYALAEAGLGEAYWRRYDFSKQAADVALAFQSCKRAQQINDRLAIVHQTLGLIYSGTGKHEEAIREFHKALELHPRDSDSYRELAYAYESAGRTAEAESTYKKAIEIWPDSWAGYNALGVFYYVSGRYPEAEKMFLKVIEITPDNVRGYSNLGGLYHLMGKYDLAAQMLQKSLAIEPTAEGYTNLGTLYFFLARYAECVPLMEKAVELSPREYSFWGNLADAYRWSSGMQAKAPSAYQTAIRYAREQLEVNPNDPDARSRLAIYCIKIGDKGCALAEIEKARALAPGNVNVMFKQAVIYELAGMRDQALQSLESARNGGYSQDEIEHEPELMGLRQDIRYKNSKGLRGEGNEQRRSEGRHSENG